MEEFFYSLLGILYFIFTLFIYKIVNILIPTSKKKIIGFKLDRNDKKKVKYFRDISCNEDIYEI